MAEEKLKTDIVLAIINDGNGGMRGLLNLEKDFEVNNDGDTALSMVLSEMMRKSLALAAIIAKACKVYEDKNKSQSKSLS